MRIAIAILVLVTCAAPVRAQSFAAGVHFASSKWSEFDGSDSGFGGRFTWKLSTMVGVDAELTWYPSDFQRDAVPFSRQRVEGMFGATIGPRIHRIRPFAKAAAGFLKVSPTSGGFACVAIFPPPLACLLAGGKTMPAYEIGGGVEIDAASRTFIRADVSDRILRYPGPVFRGFGLDERVDDNFFGGALKFSIGAGWRF
ncbi:MAG: porin family protein [Cyanobacteria bacterium]|nr:porin family protein [Cyanobacteriota bacterium]